MQFSAIYHKASGQMSYAANQTDLIINLKTGYDVEKVFIHYSDPFEAGILGSEESWQGTRKEILHKKRLSHHLWWTATLVPPYKRCRYFFELQSVDGTWFYFENGFLTKEQLHTKGRMLQCFVIPWMNPADINKTPEWVNGTVWYQIFPDRFCNGTPQKNTADIHPWRSGSVTNCQKYGGNLAGICQKLPYLRDLGINGIYLNPVMEAESIHKYDTRNYTNIDPDFGTNEEFAQFVEDAHKSGIRVMVDAVFNHCGPRFEPWADVLENGKNSEYADWFMVQDWDQIGKHADTRDGRFYSFAFMGSMPKLNTNSPKVRQYFCEICAQWIHEFHIDGIRFDVGNEVSHLFLKELRRHLKEIKPDLYMLGEIWHDAGQWLQGDEYDAVMNYPLLMGIHDFFLDHTLGQSDFEYMLNRCYTMYMRQNNHVMFNLLDSHDTERLMSRCGNLDIFYQQLALLFTLPGSPCIFYGTEIALEGGHDPDCRRPMPWEELRTRENQEKLEMMKRLIQMRKNEASCRSLDFDFPRNYPQKRCLEYVKADAAGDAIEVLLNCGEDGIEVLDGKEVLFSRNYEGGILGANGTLIRRM